MEYWKVYMNKEQKSFFENLYKNNFIRTKKLCNRKLSNKFDADDCCSKVYELVIKNIDKLMQHENPNGWVMKTTSNIIHEFYRSKTKRNKIESIENIILPSTYSEDNIAETVSFHDMVNYIYINLDKKERRLFNAIYLKDLNNQLISVKYNISYSSVTTQKNRLKKKLVKIIKNYNKL